MTQSAAPFQLPERRLFLLLSYQGALALILLGCKVHRLSIGTAPMSAGTRLSSVAADLCFLAASGAVWAWLLSLATVGRYFVWPVRVVTTVLMVAAVCEHAFFLSTGATLDWHILTYAIAHAGELRPILLSEVGRRRSLVIALTLAAWTLPAALQGVGALQRFAHRIGHARSGGASRPVQGVIAMGLLFLSVFVVSNSSAELPSFAGQNLYYRLARAAMREWTRETASPRRPGGTMAQRLIETPGRDHFNVVIVVLESARAKSFSAYSGGPAVTPFFDELSRGGTLVENAYTVVPHTTKALVSIQCGIYPRLDPEPREAEERGIPVKCLPDLLRQADYASAFFQPAEENFERRRELVDRFGYDLFVGRQSLPSKGFDDSNYLGLEDRALLHPVMNWVDQQTGRFVLTVLTLGSHHPYAIPAGFESIHHAPDRAMNDYLNTLRYTDSFLRDLHHEFERRSLLDRTVFVVVGDHGEGFGEHGVQQHDAVPYEEGLRVPLALSGPPFKAGRHVGGLRQHIDILPTVLEAIGFQVEPRILPGRGLISSEGHDKLFFSCHYRDYCLASRDRSNKFIYHYTRRSPEWFTLVDDPGERINLTRANSIAAKACRNELETWKARVNAQFVDGHDWKLTRDVSWNEPRVAHPLDVMFGSELRLLGYDIDRRVLTEGEQVTVTHHFRVERKVPPHRSLVFHLMGPRPEDLSHVPVDGAYPLSRWQVGEYVTDTFVYFARPGTPIGNYHLMLGLWDDKHSTAPLGAAVPHTSTALVDERQRVETVAWEMLPGQFDRDDFIHAAPPQGFGTDKTALSPEIELLGCRLTKGELKRGIRTTLSCLFHALGTPAPGRICIRVEGPASRATAHDPVRGRYPMHEWRRGQYVQDDVDIFMLMAEPNGGYDVSVALEPYPSGDAKLAEHPPCSEAGQGRRVATFVLHD